MEVGDDDMEEEEDDDMEEEDTGRERDDEKYVLTQARRDQEGTNRDVLIKLVITWDIYRKVRERATEGWVGAMEGGRKGGRVFLFMV
jgi:hypothetical protein